MLIPKHAAGLYLSLALGLSSALVGCATDQDTLSDADAGPGEGEGKADGLSAACANLTAGPFQPVALGHVFDGSEDFAFDGRGSMVAKRGNNIVQVSSQGTVTGTIAALPGQTLGLRYHPTGYLIGAMVGAGKLVSVEPTGRVRDLATGLNGPNGVYVAADGNTYFTEGGANRVTRLAPDGTRKTLVGGTQSAQGANGIVVNSATKRLYYTEYDKGRINRLDLGAQNPSPVQVTTIPGARLDGLVLDSCGNLYVLDQGRSRLYRVRIGANGGAAAAPELLASFPVNVANAQFGAGAGFASNKLYVVGNPGTVFVLPVGITGAAVPTPAVPRSCAHTFRLPGTGAEQSVEVRGDFKFNAWAAGVPMAFDAAQHAWQATVELPAGSPTQYKFHYFKAGTETWSTDPTNASTAGGNSVVTATCP